MKTKNRSYRGAGFSLVEIMIVLAFLCLFAALAIPKCVAQVPTYASGVISGIPATITTATATNYPLNVAPFIDTSRSRFIGIQTTITTSTVGTTNTYTFAPSMDSISYDLGTAHEFFFTNIVLAGAFTNTAAGTLDIGANQSVKLVAITPFGSATITNQSAATGQKISSP